MFLMASYRGPFKVMIVWLRVKEDSQSVPSCLAVSVSQILIELSKKFLTLSQTSPGFYMSAVQFL